MLAFVQVGSLVVAMRGDFVIVERAQHNKTKNKDASNVNVQKVRTMDGQ